MILVLCKLWALKCGQRSGKLDWICFHFRFPLRLSVPRFSSKVVIARSGTGDKLPRAYKMLLTACSSSRGSH